MAYSLYIERKSPISPEEWLNAVAENDGLKIDESDSVAINPLTGDEIRVPGLPATAALWFSDTGEWKKIFQFRRGKVSFSAADWDDPRSPLQKTAFELARKLNARIVGDEGEIYTR